MERGYRDGRPVGKPRVVFVPETSYFDDLSEGWIISHYETVPYYETVVYPGEKYSYQWEEALELIGDFDSVEGFYKWEWVQRLWIELE